jgi:hypothetical protein
MFGPKTTSLVISDLDELFDTHAKRAYADAACDSQLRVAIAKAAAPAVINFMSTHVSSSVRSALAANRNLTDEIVWQLAGDASMSVRLQLASNAFLSTFVLESLAEDEDQRVASRANKTLASLSLSIFSTNPLRHTG